MVGSGRATLPRMPLSNSIYTVDSTVPLTIFTFVPCFISLQWQNYSHLFVYLFSTHFLSLCITYIYDEFLFFEIPCRVSFKFFLHSTPWSLTLLFYPWIAKLMFFHPKEWFLDRPFTKGSILVWLDLVHGLILLIKSIN